MKQNIFELCSMKCIKRVSAAILMAGGCGASLSAVAVERSLVALPTGWQLQNYIAVPPSQPNSVVFVFFTGHLAACGQNRGQLQMAAIAPPADHRLFYNTVVTGKATKVPIFVFYDDVTCNISSFGFAAQ